MATPGTLVTVGQLVTPGGDQGLTGSPGLTGPPGSTGATGAVGPAAHTFSTADFVVPPVGSTVAVTVLDTSWMAVGEVIWIQGANGTGLAGAMRVQSILGTTVTLLNIASSSPAPGDMTMAVYDVNQNGIVDTADSIAWASVTNKRIANFYGADTTNSGTYAISTNTDFALITGVTVFFTISIANSAASPTLNVNSTGAVSIRNRANIALSANELSPRTHGVVYDGVSWRLITPIARIYSATNPANPTIECQGYDSILAYALFSSATGAGITLAHVASGTPVSVDIVNTTGAAMSYFINMTTPTGAAYGGTYIFLTTNATATATYRVDSGATPSLTNGNHMMLSGIAGIGYFK